MIELDTVMKWSQYLWHRVDSADFTDQFTVALKKEQELKVQFVQTLTQFQLLKRTKYRNITRLYIFRIHYGK